MTDAHKKQIDDSVKATILLVEGNNKDHLFIQRSIYNANLPVYTQTVKNTLEAMVYLKGQGIYANRAHYPLPVVILTNINKPSMSGLDLLIWVEQQPELTHIPVVVMNSSSQTVNIAINVDTKSYFAETFSFDGLIDIVKHFLLDDYSLIHPHLSPFSIPL